ncbi:MAG: hypothetical protein ACK5PP_16960 [Acidimicrobiales bacterium]
MSGLSAVFAMGPLVTGLLAMIVLALAIVLGLLIVLVDRLNFPQRQFRPRQIEVGDGDERDRTGAHIVEEHAGP